MPGGAGSQVLTLGNTGANATGAVQVIYTLPLFVNVDRSQPLPGVCTFLFEDQDFTVQEIIRCVMPGPGRDQSVPIAIPVIVSSEASRGVKTGRVVVMPAADSADAEQFVPDNVVVVAVRIVRNSSVPLPAGHPVDLYLTADTLPNLLTNRPGIETLIVTNKGPNATQGVTRVTFATPVFVNIDRARPWPAGCRFLYENTDPAVSEMVECLIDAPIPAGGQVRLPIPLRVTAGAPTGTISAMALVRRLPGSPDVEQAMVDNTLRHGVVVSALPTHPVRFYLHTTDITGTAGGFTMTPTPAPGALSVNLLSTLRWFSAPALVGTFDPGAHFRVVTPCLLGAGVTYTLSNTGLNGDGEQPLGQRTTLLSLCLGQQVVTIPVLTPISLENRRLKLTLKTLLGLKIPLGANTYLEGTMFRGTP